MDSSGTTFHAMMLVAVLAVTAVNFARGGETSCTDDRDCSYEQYCYNVSSMCVDFTPCSRYNRVEGPKPARHSSQCGSCYPGYTAELLGTGVRESVCKNMMNSKGTQTDSESELVWPWYWVVITIVVVLALVILLAILLRKFICTTNREKFCKKMIPWNTRPTAPPQHDEATYHLRSKTYPGDEERPPIYSSVIGPSIDNNNLVNAAPYVPPDWVMKPNYDHDYNDNVADGVAMPIRTSSTNVQMDLDEEEETNPSSWTPGQPTVDVPSRPFARFASEQRDNAMNNVLLRGNCSSNSNHEESSSDEAAGLPEEPSGSRSHGDIFCGPNVQINQTITLNIGKNGTK